MTDDLFQGRLLPGEHILWSGQPGQGVIFVRRDFLLILSTLLGCAVAVFSPPRAGRPVLPGFRALFVIVGLMLLLGHFFVDAWLRRRMRYAVTNRRLLIGRSAPFATFKAFDVARLPTLVLAERGDGRGTIRFDPTVSLRYYSGVGDALSILNPIAQFFVIEDARRVFELVQGLRGSGP